MTHFLIGFPQRYTMMKITEADAVWMMNDNNHKQSWWIIIEFAMLTIIVLTDDTLQYQY